MNLLLDTHTLLWAEENQTLLSPTALVLLQNPANDRVLSWATLWEIAVKVSVGKLRLTKPFNVFVADALLHLPATMLGMDVQHTNALAALPLHHRDPFDRMLVAQALVERIPLISADARLDAYGIDRRW